MVFAVLGLCDFLVRGAVLVVVVEIVVVIGGVGVAAGSTIGGAESTAGGSTIGGAESTTGVSIAGGDGTTGNGKCSVSGNSSFSFVVVIDLV